MLTPRFTKLAKRYTPSIATHPPPRLIPSHRPSTLPMSTLPHPARHPKPNPDPDPLSLIPPNPWDSHMHVFSPEYLSPAQIRDSPYTPPRATIPQAITVLDVGFGSTGRVGMTDERDSRGSGWGVGVGTRMCIVQPSVYGVDNTVTLDGLKDLNLARSSAQVRDSGRSEHDQGEEEVEVTAGGCAVVEIDPGETSETMLMDLHKRGARGVRLNLKSRGQTLSPADLRQTLDTYARLIRSYGWALQVYLGMDMLDGLEPGWVGELGVPLVLDHFAHPQLSKRGTGIPVDLPGYRSLLDLYAHPGSKLYVKVSGQYRIVPPTQGTRAETLKGETPTNDVDVDTDEYSELKRIFLELARIDPTRLVWGSDWPHTRFEGIDTIGWARTVVGWCRDLAREQAGQGAQADERAQELVGMVFKTNADELWLGRRVR